MFQQQYRNNLVGARVVVHTPGTDLWALLLKALGELGITVFAQYWQ